MPWQVRIQRMPEFKRAKSIAFIGYALAATGTLLFTQIERIQNLRLGSAPCGFFVGAGMAAFFGGFATAIVGSAIWARRTPARQPLKIAASIAAASLLITFAVGINVHGPSVILMFVVILSMVNVVSVLIASGR
jgi:prolipoprotein diacylglyceryltransferase